MHPEENPVAPCPRLPAMFRRAGPLLPLALACRAGEPLLNRIFRTAIEDGMLDALESRETVIEVQDAGIVLAFRLCDGRLRIAAPASADVRIRGPFAAFAWLAAREADADTLFFNRHLVMEGDTELGLTIKNVIDATDFTQLPAPLRQALVWLTRAIPAQAPGARMPG